MSFVLIVAAVKLVLYKYTGEDDLTIGTAVCRDQSRKEDMAAPNRILALRTRVSDDISAREWIAGAQRTVSEALQRQSYPFERVRAGLEIPPAATGRMFGTVIALKNIHSQEDLAAVTGDVRLILNLDGGAVRGVIEYQSSLYLRASVESFAKHIAAATQDLINQADERLFAIRLRELPYDAAPVSLSDLTMTRAPAHEIFEDRAERAPDAVAVVDEQGALSYGELNRRSNQVAHLLRECGIGPDALVGVCVERSVDLIVGILGVQKAGGAYVPLEPSYPQARLDFMVEDTGVSVILSQTALRHRLPAGRRIVRLDAEDVFANEHTANPGIATSPDQLAYVIFTSGSSGQPKAAMNTHRAVANRLEWMQSAYGLTAQDRVLQKTPCGFDVSVWEFFWPLMTGSTLVMARPGGHRDSAYLRDSITKEQITTLHFVPSMLQAFLMDAGAWNSPALARIICSGEALTTDLRDRCLAQLPLASLHNLYGPTEAAVDVTAWECRRGERLMVTPIGPPISNVSIYVLDARGDRQGAGAPGELHIGGIAVGRGYWNRPELTAEKFAPDPFSAFPGARLYRTGDRARLLPGGDLLYLGRLDRQVKIRGQRIELGEIESSIMGHDGVRQAVVILREDSPGDKRLAAYVVTRKDCSPPESPDPETAKSQSLDSGALRRFLQTRLPEYMIPPAIIVLEALPLTPNGKVDQRALPAPAGTSAGLLSDFAPPETSTELALAGIWGETLGVDRVGRHDRFLALGGHSLLATRVASRMREELGVDLPLRSLLDDTTLAELAVEANLERRAVLPSIPVIASAARMRPPLSFAQQRLWFIDQLEPGQATYNMPAAIKLDGPLNIDALRRAINEIVRRHESLRTRFEMSGDEPKQVIDPASTMEIPVIDLSDFAEESRERRAVELAEEEAALPFDLGRESVLRVKLLKLAEREHVLLATIHHIASDGWSIGVMRREFATLYEAYAKGDESPLPPLPIQYADYAVWQRGWLRGEVLEAQLEYWRRQLADLTPLELPTDHERPPVQSYRGAQESFFLEADLTAALRDLSRQEGVTLFMTLLTAFQSLLYRCSGQGDIVIGTPIANRNRVELEELIGFFVNTLALRVRISSEDTYRELLDQTRRSALAAYSNDQIPFEKLVEELSPKRVSGQNPIFQAWFVLDNTYSNDDLVLPEIRISSVKSEFTMAKLDLALTLETRSNGITGAFTYATDLFEPETISALIVRFRSLLHAIVRQPDCKLLDLPIADLSDGRDSTNSRAAAAIEESQASFYF